MRDNKVSTKGIGFVGLLQIAFIVLKLCKVINWSWLTVLIPSVVEVIIFIVCAVIIAIASK